MTDTATQRLVLQVNGQPADLQVEPATLLIDLLREQLNLTGPHVGCDTAQCGACTVLLDGQAVKSCNVLAVQAAGGAVTTVEGLPALAGPAATLHPLQDAFMACHGLQCGYCTPGMLMSAAGLLAEHPKPSRDQIVHALEGNLCRCTGYVNIVAAVEQAAQVMNSGRAAAAAAGSQA